MSISRFIALVVVLVLMLAGAIYFAQRSDNNISSTNSDTTTSSGTDQEISGGSITMTNMLFTPSQITVQKGAAVTWTNSDTVVHTVVADLGNGPDSGDIAPGSSYSYTFTDTGSYQYHCSLHPSMRGTIVVK
jgi:plastocyanin